MAGRRTKQTVDYFPHYTHRDTFLDCVLFILEERYGKQEGYAFFYKLQELLAVSDGHVYDCREKVSFEYLQSKCLSPGISGPEILQHLADMQVIDAELWKIGVIWMPSFVESLREAYSKRTVPLPEKPSVSLFLPPEILREDNFRPGNDADIQAEGISDAGNTQSRENESKEKNITHPGGCGSSEALADPPTDQCPHQQIIKLYHEILPALPRVKEWTVTRSDLLRTRWREKPERQNIDWWKDFFLYVAHCGLLVGHGEKGWMADLEWLVRPNNFVKVLEGRYEDRRPSQPGLSRSSIGIMSWAERRKQGGINA